MSCLRESFRFQTTRPMAIDRGDQQGQIRVSEDRCDAGDVLCESAAILGLGEGLGHRMKSK